jgi:hypothetical protein
MGFDMRLQLAPSAASGSNKDNAQTTNAVPTNSGVSVHASNAPTLTPIRYGKIIPQARWRNRNAHHLRADFGMTDRHGVNIVNSIR